MITTAKWCWWWRRQQRNNEALNMVVKCETFQHCRTQRTAARVSLANRKKWEERKHKIYSQCECANNFKSKSIYMHRDCFFSVQTVLFVACCCFYYRYYFIFIYIYFFCVCINCSMQTTTTWWDTNALCYKMLEA